LNLPPPPKTLCFDLDGTLCTNTGGAYDTAQPFPWAIARVNALGAAGYRVIVFTARGTATGIDWREVTEGQLERWGVNYDELHLGKPSAAVYVDDRAVHTTAWQADDAFSAPGFGELDLASEVEQLPVPPPPPLPAVVELGRTFGGSPVRLDAHIGRLLVASAAAGLRDAPSADEIRGAVEDALERAGGGGDLVYAISFTPAVHAAYLDVWRDDPSPRAGGVEVACRPLAQVSAGLAPLLAGSGMAVFAATTPQDRPPPAWQLRTRADGTLGDSLGGQLGIVEAGKLVLEPPGPLPGIASGWVLELAAVVGVEAEERAITLEELRAADEAAVVGFPFCVLPLAAVDGVRVGTGEAGPVTQRLIAAWGDEVGIALGDDRP
jgi:branched-subunit amino acid aminotransferase/4-amino-4-deoxychorismate lyase